MFKFFKEKLQNLLGKKEEAEKEKELEPAEPKKEVKKSKEPVKTEKKKKPVEKKEIKIEEIKEVKEEIKVQEPAEKKSAIQKFFGIKKKPEKIEESQELKQEIHQEVEEIIEKAEEKAEKPEKTGFFSKIQTKFNTIKLDQQTFNEFFESLEMLLLENNVALEVVDKIRNDMEKRLVNIEVKKDKLEQEVRNTLKDSISDILIEPFDIIEKINKKDAPFIILFFGINGSGKTTTIAKLAHLLQKNKISCVLAASDTFRAASIEQLKQHGDKLGIKVIAHDYGADPSAVAFDAIKYAQSHKIKAVLIDTAGRMHTKDNLLKEMEKIVRVTKPDLKIFVAESITGNDATEQARIFNETANLDGTILTKADVDEKGGTAISIGYITKKPILYLGIGQSYSDLEKFDKKDILVNLGLE